MFTDINSEDRLVQKTFVEHLEKQLGWESVYAWNEEMKAGNPVILVLTPFATLLE